MLINLFKKFRTTLYVQIWEKRIKVTHIQTRNVYDEQPLVAFEIDKKGKKIIAAIGNAARSFESKENTIVVNPFSHPRVLFSDFEAGEKLLQHIIQTLSERKVFATSPEIVIHPMEKTEGGLTMIEVRAFKELGYGAGGRDVAVYQGKELPIYDFDFDSIKTRYED